MHSGYLFFSHSGSDFRAAGEVVTALRARGLGIWFDQDDLKPGDAWQPQIEAAIAGASGMLVYVGAQRIEKWVDREVRAGLVRNTADPAKFPLIPLIGSGGSVESLPIFLSQHQAVTLQSAPGIDRLVRALGADGARAVDAATGGSTVPFGGCGRSNPRTHGCSSGAMRRPPRCWII